jgi:hypothetical protein
MNDDNPGGEVRPRSTEAAHMRPESQAQASDRGCGQPHGRVQAVIRLPHAADRHMFGVGEPANGESRVNSHMASAGADHHCRAAEHTAW